MCIRDRDERLRKLLKAAMWGMLVIIWIYQAYIQGNNAICPVSYTHLVIDVFVMTGAHAVLKKMLVRSRYTKGIQSLVGVVTTQENASPILEELKKDWSKRVTGLAILEAAPEQLHTEIDGVKIEANFDNFMDWLRQAALDEVYLDVAQESEENMLPYLEEMESMGLTVHFRLPVLDRIEKACCDEISAVRISRELSRCAGGNVVTMGTVEIKLRDQVLKLSLIHI